MQESATEADKDTMFLIRVTHSSGMLEGHYTPETVFPPNDHRNHRPRSWLLNGVKKIDTLRSAFGIPLAVHPIGTIAVGYATANDRRSTSLRRGRRPALEVVHRGRW